MSSQKQQHRKGICPQFCQNASSVTNKMWTSHNAEMSRSAQTQMIFEQRNMEHWPMQVVGVKLQHKSPVPLFAIRNQHLIVAKLTENRFQGSNKFLAVRTALKSHVIFEVQSHDADLSWDFLQHADNLPSAASEKQDLPQCCWITAWSTQSATSCRWMQTDRSCNMWCTAQVEDFMQVTVAREVPKKDSCCRLTILIVNSVLPGSNTGCLQQFHFIWLQMNRVLFCFQLTSSPALAF